MTKIILILALFLICFFPIESDAKSPFTTIQILCPAKTSNGEGTWNFIKDIFEFIVPAALPNASRADKEKLACYDIDRIRLAAQKNNQDLKELFNDTIDNTVKFYQMSGQDDDLLAVVLSTLLSQNSWDWNTGTPYRQWLGLLYANPSGKIYNEERALHLFKRAALSKIFATSTTEECDAALKKEIASSSASGLRLDGLQWGRFICEANAYELTILAKGHETCKGGMIDDPALASFLYLRSSYLGSIEAKESFIRLEKYKTKGLLQSHACFTSRQS